MHCAPNPSCALMIDHEVGVSARTLKVAKLDSDYFDEAAG